MTTISRKVKASLLQFI